MTYTPPVYDRTALDITNLTAKAFFNVADWVRVYNNALVVNELVEFLLSINITFDTVTTPTITTIPTVTQLNTLLANIERIRVAACLPAITGLTEVTAAWVAGNAEDSPTYLDANTWERVLDVIYNSIAASVEYQPYCGVFAVGQPRFYQHRFRQFAAWIPNSAAPVRRARTGVASANAGLKRNNGFRRYD